MADKLTSMIGGQDLAKTVLADARISAIRALLCVPRSAEDEVAHHQILEWSAATATAETLALVRLDIELTAGLAALVLARYAYHWPDLILSGFRVSAYVLRDRYVAYAVRLMVDETPMPELRQRHERDVQANVVVTDCKGLFHAEIDGISRYAATWHQPP